MAKEKPITEDELGRINRTATALEGTVYILQDEGEEKYFIGTRTGRLKTLENYRARLGTSSDNGDIGYFLSVE